MGINLDKVVTDLLLIIRGSQVSQSEVISKRQIEDWVHQYRALILKRDLDKGHIINPDYIQEIDDVSMSMVEGSGDNPISSDCYILRSDKQLPKTIDLNKGNGLVYVGSILGRQFQIVPFNRLHFQQYEKYTSGSELASLRNQYVYVKNSEELRYISIRGVFENPLEVTDFTSVNYRTNYPLPQDKIPILKQMILSQELNIEAKSPSDTTNDSSHRLSPNAEKQPVNNSK